MGVNFQVEALHSSYLLKILATYMITAWVINSLYLKEETLTFLPKFLTKVYSAKFPENMKSRKLIPFEFS